MGTRGLANEDFSNPRRVVEDIIVNFSNPCRGYN